MNSLLHFILFINQPKRKKMKPKNFIVLILFAYVLAGCKFDSDHTKEEQVVSHILHSQKTIYNASKKSDYSLLSHDIYHADSYYHDSFTQEDILSLKLDVGNVRLSGYNHTQISLSNITLDFDLDTITQDYIYDYQGYMYDAYHDRYRFITTKPFVGSAHNNPYKGAMEIVGNLETINIRVIDEVNVDIHVYDHYDSYHDRVIHSTWHRLGF